MNGAVYSFVAFGKAGQVENFKLNTTYVVKLHLKLLWCDLKSTFNFSLQMHRYQSEEITKCQSIYLLILLLDVFSSTLIAVRDFHVYPGA